MDLLPLTKQSNTPAARISVYAPGLHREQVAARLDDKSLFGLFRLIRHSWIGPLRSIADVYVPFLLYRVRVENGGNQRAHLIAVDCVDGTLDPYRFDFIPDESKLTRVETRNALPSALEEAKTREIAAEHIRRQTYLAGFLTLRPIRLRAEPVHPEFCMLFWVGFFGKGAAVRFRVLDGVRGEIQGAKARAFFGNWLLSETQ